MIEEAWLSVYLVTVFRHNVEGKTLVVLLEKNMQVTVLIS